MDDKKLVVENHEEIKNKDFLPINRIRDLSDRLEKLEEICKKDAELYKNVNIIIYYYSRSNFGKIFNLKTFSDQTILSRRK